jgi:hypothetical protein
MTEPGMKINYCEWTLDEDTSSWDSQCDKKWELTVGDPSENGMKFCPFCGRVLKQIDAIDPIEEIQVAIDVGILEWMN